MKLDPEKFKFPERYTQPHPYLPIRVGRKGEIFSQPSDGKPVKVLKSQIDKGGYKLVCVCVDGKKKRFLVHRLCWETYSQQRIPDGMQINHINEIKTDNRPENLEVCTVGYNINYGTRNAKVSKAMTNGKTSKPVLQLTLDGNLVREWPSVHEVERQIGFSHQGISKACRGKYKTAYGFKWKYK